MSEKRGLMPRKEKLRTLLVCLALGLGAALLFWPVVTFDFVVLDDSFYLLNNFHVNRGFTWEGWRWCFNAGYSANWHPLTWMSHMLDCQLYGLKPGGHHATNVLLHALNSMLLFLVLQRMTGAFWRSAMLAALFAWHPLHVESVAWVAERKDVLSGLFFILTIWAYVRYAEERQAQGAKRNIFYAAAVLLFALGLMAKPMLVTLPFVLLLLDWWPLGRVRQLAAAPGSPAGKAAGRPRMGRLLLEKAPFLVLSGVSCVLTIHAQHLGGAISSLTDYSLQSRLSNSLVAYFRYVAKVLWPDNLSVMYVFNRHLPYWEPVAAAFFLVAISAVAARFWKTRPYFLMGWLWYLGTLVPVIGLVQVGGQAMADRYTYLPSIGLFVLFIWGACDLVRGWRHGPAFLGGLAWAALLACALLTGQQIQYWRNGGTLFAHSLEVDPDNFMARSYYASYLLGNHQLERARVECEKSIRLESKYETAHGILGNVLLLEEKYDQAARELAIALQMDPASSQGRFFYGMALLGQDRHAEAEQQFEIVLAADPVFPDAHYGLGRVLVKLGKPNEALAQFTEALRLAPRHPDARFQLAVLLAAQGKTAQAVSQYRLARNVPPSAPDSGVMNNLAWILAASSSPELRQGAEAVKLAARACELDQGRQPMFLGTLAAAYAEAGRFDEAVAAAQQAHDLALKLAAEARNPADKKAAKDLAARNLELLEIYRSGRPYHEK
jgi:tetratricopeptide (TPR) repeat protein